MENGSSLVFAGIAPHPPIMVPEVGREAIADVRGSIDAMAELTRRIIKSNAETVVMISPHAPLDPYSFVAYEGPQLTGNFSSFSAAATRVEAPLDEELLNAITSSAALRNYPVTRLENYSLDHGTAVPLYFLKHNGWNGRLVALGYSFLSNEDHIAFGACIREAIENIGRRVAIVASGDLSHRLKTNAPAGYNPEAYIFDAEVVDALRQGEPERIVSIDQDMRRVAGECGYRSMLVVLGATQEMHLACDVLHYEAPFGVGYLVAQITSAAAGGDKDEASDQLPRLARQAVEAFIRTGTQIKPPVTVSGLLAARAACFVSLKTSTGELRGCIGTIEPASDILVEELIANAINAATRDPRFSQVTEEELPGLRYSVDVLSATEPATLEDLDPAVYGVIVEDESGSNRGLLLPDLEGVVTAGKQVEIATRKAGLAPGTPVKLFRFRVERFREAPSTEDD